MQGKHEVENEFLQDEYNRITTLMSMSQQYQKNKLKNSGKNYCE